MVSQLRGCGETDGSIEEARREVTKALGNCPRQFTLQTCNRKRVEGASVYPWPALLSVLMRMSSPERELKIKIDVALEGYEHPVRFTSNRASTTTDPRRGVMLYAWKKDNGETAALSGERVVSVASVPTLAELYWYRPKAQRKRSHYDENEKNERDQR